MTATQRVGITLLLYCFLPQAIQAEPLDWLYEVHVPVSARTQELAEQAIDVAFTILLIRLTGKTDVMQEPSLAGSPTLAQAHVNQFTYTEREDQKGDITDLLVVSFTRDTVEILLRENKLPVWPADRPSILLWLTIHDRNESWFVERLSHSGEKIFERARTRGVELILPNEKDPARANLTTSSIVGRFWLDLHEVSKSYSTDMIAAVAAERNLLNRVTATLTYWYKEKQFDFVIEIDSPDNIERDVVDHVVDFLVQRQTIYRDQQTVHRLLVHEVTSVEVYAEVMKIMNNYDFIDRCEVARYNNGVLWLDIYTPSTELQLIDLLIDHAEFEPIEAQPEDSSTSFNKAFRLIED